MTTTSAERRLQQLCTRVDPPKAPRCLLLNRDHSEQIVILRSQPLLSKKLRISIWQNLQTVSAGMNPGNGWLSFQSLCQQVDLSVTVAPFCSSSADNLTLSLCEVYSCKVTLGSQAWRLSNGCTKPPCCAYCSQPNASLKQAFKLQQDRGTHTSPH